MTPRPVDVLVVGAGAVGVCAAHYLAAAGRQVTVVDQGRVGGGASHGNAGLLVPSHSVPLAEPGMVRQALGWMLDPESPFYIRWRWDPALWSWLWRFWRAGTRARVQRAMPLIRSLSFASLDLYRELAALEGMDFGLACRGWLKLFRTAQGLDEEVAAAQLMAGVGIEHQVLAPDQLRTVEPALAGEALAPGLAGGVHYPQDANVDPARFVAQLAARARTAGVEICEDTEVLGFERRGRRVAGARTTRGELQPGAVVLATGAWTPLVSRDLGLGLPMEPAKGYSVTLRGAEGAPATPLYCAERKVAVSPVGDRVRFAGTLELAGQDLSVNERRVRALMRAVPEYLPALDPARLEVEEVWRGPRPCTPDGLPYLGRARAFDNLVVAAGHAMIGISLGPVTGRIVADLVGDRDPGVDLSLTAVERYG
ncbi:MAG: FAD-dependent oxidoreductase [Gemmatimonadota bacterium]